MRVAVGDEVRHMGQRVKVVEIIGQESPRAIGIIYMTGSFAGREVAVSEEHLEELTATARPTFRAASQVAL